ncbi:MAG: hypothetical protein JWP91_2108 [Fibrobacteres bacterium]|nr:hypothetical protein [Fibrobacterota bacterium]
MKSYTSTKSAAGRKTHKGLALALSLGLLCGAASMPAVAANPKVLDFWGVGGFAHGSRIAANTLLDSLAIAMKFDLIKTDQASVMTAANLAQYSVVILNNSTESGKIFNTDQRTALLAYMNKGGFVGFHGSGDSKGSWPDYTTYLGGELSSHGGGIAKLDIDTGAYAKNHPIMKGLPITQSFDEEWYAYKTNPRLAAGVHVLYTLDESSCAGCTKMGGDHPIIWVKDAPEGGRTFYYAMGHGDNIFKKNDFCKTVLARSLSWASKCAINSDICGPSDIHQGPAKPAGAGIGVANGARSLTIKTSEFGSHKVELLSLSGKRIAQRSGTGVQSYTFDNLKGATVYSVVVATKNGRNSRLVTVQ